MTRETAIGYLREYRRIMRRNPIIRSRASRFNMRCRIDFKTEVYTACLIDELIDRIRRSERDPIEIVREFYYWMDNVICSSERAMTWEFTGTMENIASDILSYLREKEKKR